MLEHRPAPRRERPPREPDHPGPWAGELDRLSSSRRPSSPRQTEVPCLWRFPENDKRPVPGCWPSDFEVGRGGRTPARRGFHPAVSVARHELVQPGQPIRQKPGADLPVVVLQEHPGLKALGPGPGPVGGLSHATNCPKQAPSAGNSDPPGLLVRRFIPPQSWDGIRSTRMARRARLNAARTADLLRGEDQASGQAPRAGVHWRAIPGPARRSSGPPPRRSLAARAPRTIRVRPSRSPRLRASGPGG